MLRRASNGYPQFVDRIGLMKMSALLSRTASSRPGITGTARVDRDIERLLRRVTPGDIVVIDALDLDRITADALVEADVVAVINASPSISGRYPNLGPEVLVANGVTLIDETGPEVFKKVKDGARVRLHEGGVYSGDRRLILGTERTDHEIHELMVEAKSGLVAHLEAFAGNTIEFIRSESPLLIDGIGIPDIDVDVNRRHVVVVAEEPNAAADLKALKPFIKEYQPVLVGVGSGADNQFARPVFGALDQLRYRLDWQRRIDHQRESHLRRQRDRHEVLARVVGQAFVDSGIGGQRCAGCQKQCVAVGWRLGQGNRRDHCAAAGPVLDQHRLAEPLRQLLANGTGNEIDSAPRRQRHQDRNRPAREILRERRTRERGESNKRERKALEQHHVRFSQ